MSLPILDVLGIAAGTLTTISFVAQVIKTWKTKLVRDISLIMYSFFSAGIILWIVYGFTVDSLPIIAANSVTLVLTGIIIYLKLKYNDHPCNRDFPRSTQDKEQDLQKTRQ